MTTQTTVSVPSVELSGFRKRIAIFNKKATKNGVPNLNITTINERTIVRGDRIVPVFDITLESYGININNYQVNAIFKCDSNGTVQSTFNGEFEITGNNDIDFTLCEHCNTKHKRKTVIQLSNNNSKMQVGLSCVKDVLGLSVSTFEWFIEKSDEILNSNYDLDDKSYSKVGYKIEYVLATLHPIYKKYGYQDKYHESPTKFKVSDGMFNKYVPTEDDIAWARKAIEIVTNSLPTNDFENNLYNIVKSGYVTNNGIAIVASVGGMVEKAIRKEKEVDSPVSSSEYVGNVRERIEIEGTIKFAISLQGYYGCSTLYIIDDKDGNRFTWNATSSKYQKLEDGKTYNFVATVKEHKEYRGTKQTVLTRAKTVE